jgi:hypothetical protein
MKFYKKVLTVEAVEWPGQLTKEMKAFLNDDVFVDFRGVSIVCVGGVTMPFQGDWIVRDENGVLSVLAPNIFKERYDPVVEG